MTNVSQYGAAPNLGVDLTEYLQRAFDAESVLEFSPGTYVVSSVDFKPGQRVVGNGARILVKGGAGSHCQVFSCHRKNGHHGSHNPHYHNSRRDSDKTYFTDLDIDFRREAQPNVHEHHQAGFGFSAYGGGKVRVDIRRCTVTGSQGDGIYAGHDSDVTAHDCEFIDCERAGVVVVQRSRFRLCNLTSEIVNAKGGQRKGLDIEPNRSGDRRDPVQGVVDGFLMKSGGLDVMATPGSMVELRHIKVLQPRWVMSSAGAQLDIQNSFFESTWYDDNNCVWTYPNGSIRNSIFAVRYSPHPTGRLPAYPAVHLRWHKGTPPKSQMLRMSDCSFVAQGFENNPLQSIGILNRFNNGPQSQLYLDGCYFDDRLAVSEWAEDSHRTIVVGCLNYSRKQGDRPWGGLIKPSTQSTTSTVPTTSDFGGMPTGTTESLPTGTVYPSSQPTHTPSTTSPTTENTTWPSSNPFGLTGTTS